jgi:hypothetical protein
MSSRSDVAVHGCSPPLENRRGILTAVRCCRAPSAQGVTADDDPADLWARLLCRSSRCALSLDLMPLAIGANCLQVGKLIFFAEENQ